MTNEQLTKALDLRPSALSQLQAYVRWAEESGTYYGPKGHFDDRHAEILEALNMGDEDEPQPNIS